jgi:hypothetical protein
LRRFSVAALWGRAFADLPPAPERRRNASPQSSEYTTVSCSADYIRDLRWAKWADGHFAWQHSLGPNVRFGSKADIGARPSNVRFAPESGHSYTSKTANALLSKM